MGSGDRAPAERWMDRVVRLADLHRARLIRVACACCSELWAEDCVQEALMKIYHQRLKPDGGTEVSDGHVVQWIGRVVRNEARNQRRKEDIRACAPLEDVRDLLVAAEHDEDPVLKEAVWEAIRQLSPAQQEVVEMWMAGYSQEEIAEARDTSTETVRTHWRRAKAKLRELLKGWFGLE